MDYIYPLTAIHRAGHTELLYTFEDVRSFYKKNGWWGENWQRNWFWWADHNSNHPSIPYFRGRRDGPTRYEWIIRDEYGRKVKPTDFTFYSNSYRVESIKKVRHAEALGLPIPYTGCSKAGWKINHTAKKNSGSGKRNRDRAMAIYEAKEYGVKNSVGGRVIPWEHY